MPNPNVLHHNDLATMSEVEFLARWRSVTGQPPSAMLDRSTMVTMLRMEYPCAFLAIRPPGQSRSLVRRIG